MSVLVFVVSSLSAHRVGFLVEQFRRECVGFHGSILSFTASVSRMRHTERAIIRSSSVRMTRTVTRLASVEITPAARRVSLLFEFDAEEAQSIADARADEWRIFADTSGEDQRVQATERGGEAPIHFFA